MLCLRHGQGCIEVLRSGCIDFVELTIGIYEGVTLLFLLSCVYISTQKNGLFFAVCLLSNKDKKKLRIAVSSALLSCLFFCLDRQTERRRWFAWGEDIASKVFQPFHARILFIFGTSPAALYDARAHKPSLFVDCVK